MGARVAPPWIVRFVTILWLPALWACTNVPPEAPELSANLGKRIAALQEAHIAVVHRFVDERRTAVDRFVHEQWVPELSRQLMEEPVIANMWERVCREGTDEDRLRFLVTLGPRLQTRINEKRLDLIKPLDELELAMERRLRSEYQNALAINHTLTSFLVSSADVVENRERYVRLVSSYIGTEFDFEEALDSADEALSRVLETGQEVEERAPEIEKYKAKIGELIDRVRGSRDSEE